MSQLSFSFSVCLAFNTLILSKPQDVKRLEIGHTPIHWIERKKSGGAEPLRFIPPWKEKKRKAGGGSGVYKMGKKKKVWGVGLYSIGFTGVRISKSCSWDMFVVNTLSYWWTSFQFSLAVTILELLFLQVAKNFGHSNKMCLTGVRSICRTLVGLLYH